MSAKLPYQKVKIRYKDFEHDKKYKKYKNHYGICNEGKKEDEIWIDKNSDKSLKQLILRHELVHVRRQREGVNKTGQREEDETELEALSRTPIKYLTQGEEIIHKYLRNKNKLSPNKREDLKEIYKRIKRLLEFKN